MKIMDVDIRRDGLGRAPDVASVFVYRVIPNVAELQNTSTKCYLIMNLEFVTHCGFRQT